MSANIDYVTSHQGQAHITTQNVIDLLAGFSGDVSGIKVFPQLYDHLETQIIDALTIRVKRGAALAGGSFFILDDPYDWALDAGVVGYSRIDILYVVLYKDPDTDIESCDFDYQAGDLYPNGTTGQVPAPPSGTNIVATYPLFRMNMSDGAIQNVISYAENYISNSSLSTEIAQMKVTFQDGVDTIYNAIVAKGVTPSSSTPTDCATGINNMVKNVYNACVNNKLTPSAYTVPACVTAINGIRTVLRGAAIATGGYTYLNGISYNDLYPDTSNKVACGYAILQYTSSKGQPTLSGQSNEFDVTILFSGGTYSTISTKYGVCFIRRKYNVAAGISGTIRIVPNITNDANASLSIVLYEIY